MMNSAIEPEVCTEVYTEICVVGRITGSVIARKLALLGHPVCLIKMSYGLMRSVASVKKKSVQTLAALLRRNFSACYILEHSRYRISRF
jgi:hypothetical protein